MTSLLTLVYPFLVLAVRCAAVPIRNTPQLEFDIYNIKTPQLIGIIAGCCVFGITISVVFYLLIASGTLHRALVEIAADGIATGKSKGKGGPNAKANSFISPYHDQPELYDHLLEARSSLPLVPKVESLKGPHISVRALDVEKDIAQLFLACNGSAQYHESAYDIGRIWGWSDLFVGEQSVTPWTDLKSFTAHLTHNQSTLQHHFVVIIDNTYAKPIGLITLSRNDPANLSLNIADIWITPAFQGAKRSHEAITLMLSHFFALGYRRVTAEVDERHIIARKFWQRCGFVFEAALRKHRVVRRRNCNTALYTMLNTDWVDLEGRLRQLCGWPKAAKSKEDEGSSPVVKSDSQQSNQSKTSQGLKKKKDKKKSGKGGK